MHACVICSDWPIKEVRFGTKIFLISFALSVSFASISFAHPTTLQTLIIQIKSLVDNEMDAITSLGHVKSGSGVRGIVSTITCHCREKARLRPSWTLFNPRRNFLDADLMGLVYFPLCNSVI